MLKFPKWLTLISLTVSTVVSAELLPLPKKPPEPKDNKATAEKILLGKMLYFDTRLSLDNTISCNSCHNVTQGKAGVDNLPFSPGIKGQLGGRNSPTVLNSAFHTVQFWDGRARDLEEQAKGPITNPVEMGMKDHDMAVERIRSVPAYVEKFKKVFPSASKDPVTIDTIAQAIAAYERTLNTPNSPVDRYLKGDKKALSPLAKKGMNTFETIGCTTCHTGVNYAGPLTTPGQGFYMKFPLIGGSTYESQYQLTKDLGRYEVTKQEQDKNLWRVPTLRNVALTGPYFHNGSVKTLDEAVRVMGKTQLGRDLTPEQVEELVAFLTGLTGQLPNEKEPKIP